MQINDHHTKLSFYDINILSNVPFSIDLHDYDSIL